MAVPDEVFDPERWGKLPAPVAVPAPAAPDARAESAVAMRATWERIQASLREAKR